MPWGDFSGAGFYLLKRAIHILGFSGRRFKVLEYAEEEEPFEKAKTQGQARTDRHRPKTPEGRVLWARTWGTEPQGTRLSP